MHHVFVYGTLKRGLENHHVLEKSACIGNACTLTRFSMRDGDFPVLRNTGIDRFQVSGEVYAVDDETLSALDDLEDVASGMYDRVETDVVFLSDASQSSKAFVYIGCARYWDGLPGDFYITPNTNGHLNWLPPDKRSCR